MFKNADPGKYYYSGYGIGTDDVHERFPLSDDTGFVKDVIFFGVDMSSSVNIDKKKTKLVAEYSMKFTELLLKQ